MLRSLWFVLVLASGCTPLRPLDPDGDSGARDTSRPDLDARSTDAPTADAPGPDTSLDASDADDAALDASAGDGNVVARVDAAALPDAAMGPDARDPATDLVAWYPFTGVTDATGHGHDLNSEGVTFEGPVGTFGAGDRLWTASDPELDEIVGVTMWVRPNDTGGTRRSMLINREGHIDLSRRIGGTLRCAWGESGAPGGSTAVPSGTWTHVACVFDAGQVTLYVGGAVDEMFSTPTPMIPLMANLQVGQACCSGLDPWVGHLSDVRLWRRAPTAAEIAALAATPP